MRRATDGPLRLVTSGHGPSVVLIHGVAGSHLIWDPLVPYLAEYYTVARVDLAGYGSSPRPALPCSPHVHVRAIRDTLAAAELPAPYTLIGLSMGANLALSYAARWPNEVRDLVCIGLPYYADEAAARAGLGHNLWTRLTVRHPRISASAIPAAWWALGRSGLTRWHPGIYTPAMVREALQVDYPTFHSTVINCMLRYPYNEALARSGDKARLFIHGSDDKWSSADAVRQALAPYPASSLQVIDGSPHNVVVTAPERTAAILLEALRGREASAKPHC